MLERKTVPGNELPIPSGRRPDGDTLGQDDLVRFSELPPLPEGTRSESIELLIRIRGDN